MSAYLYLTLLQSTRRPPLEYRSSSPDVTLLLVCGSFTAGWCWLLAVTALLTDPLMLAIDSDSKALSHLGNLVTSICNLFYCFNLEIFGIGLAAYNQTHFFNVLF